MGKFLILFGVSGLLLIGSPVMANDMDLLNSDGRTDSGNGTVNLGKNGSSSSDPFGPSSRGEESSLPPENTPYPLGGAVVQEPDGSQKTCWSGDGGYTVCQ